MKVVYKKTVLERIREARYDADMAGKEIDHLVLTPTEARALMTELALPWSWVCMQAGYEFERWLCDAESAVGTRAPQPVVQVMGLGIRVEA